MSESNQYDREKFDAFIKDFVFKRKNEEYGIFNELKTNLKKYEMFKTKDEEKTAWNSHEHRRSGVTKEYLFNHYVIMILFYTRRFLNLYSPYAGSYRLRYSYDEIYLLVLEYVWAHTIDSYKIRSGVSFATYLYNTIMHKMKFIMSSARNNTLISDITFNGAIGVLAYMMKYDENKTFNEIFCNMTDKQFLAMFQVTKTWCAKFLGLIKTKVCKSFTELDEWLHATATVNDENLTTEDLFTIKQTPYYRDEDGKSRAKEIAKEILKVMDRRNISSERARKMWKLHYIDGYSVEEVSIMFNLERHNCATQIGNVNRKLRQRLTKEYIMKVA